MKILKNFMRVATVVAVAVSLSACGGDDDEPELNGGDDAPIVNPDPTPAPTPDASIPAKDPAAAKSYLENTAIDFLNIVNPADHETLVRIVGYWSENYSEFDAPANWNLGVLDEDDDYYNVKRRNPMSRMFSGLAKVVRGDVAAMSRVMNEVLNVTRFSGVYEPGRDYEWVKTGDSKDVVFKFFCNGNIVEVRATGSDANWSMTSDGIRVDVPKTATLTLKNGSVTLVDAKVNSNVDFSAHTIDVYVNASFDNVNIKSSVKGDDSRIKTETHLFYGNTQVARSTATVNGRNMVDRNAYKKLFREVTETYPWGEVDRWYELDLDQADRMFIDGTTDSAVLDRVRAAGSISGIGRLIASSEEYFDNEEFESQDDAMKACQQQAELLKKLVKVNLYLDGSANSSASVDYRPYFDVDEYGYYWEWYNEPVLLFADGTTTSFQSYFGDNNFLGIEAPLRSILYAYEGYWLND